MKEKDEGIQFCIIVCSYYNLLLTIIISVKSTSSYQRVRISQVPILILTDSLLIYGNRMH